MKEVLSLKKTPENKDADEKDADEKDADEKDADEKDVVKKSVGKGRKLCPKCEEVIFSRTKVCECKYFSYYLFCIINYFYQFI